MTEETAVKDTIGGDAVVIGDPVEEGGGLMTASRTRLLAMAAVCTTVLLVGSAAWACTPGAESFSSRPQSGPPGTDVTLSGSGFATASSTQPGVVEIRWNAVDGPLLATAAAPDFSQAVTIPDVAPRTYMIMAVQRDNQGSVTTSKATAFAVTQPLTSSPTPSAPSAPTSPSPAPGATEPAPSEPSTPAPSAASDTPAPALVPAAPQPSPAAPAQSRAAAPAASTRTAPAPAPAPVAPAAATTPGPLTATTAPAPEPAPVPQPAPEAAPAAPSLGTAGGERWSGLNRSTGSFSGSGLGEGHATSSDGAGMWIGTALLAVGTTALLGAFSVLGLRRRRAMAERRIG